MLLAPEIEEAPITQGDVLRGIDAESDGGLVDPIGWAFEFGEVADGGLVNDAMALGQMPLGAPFFITEGGDEADGEKDLGEGVAVGDFGFSLDAVFVRVFSRTGIGEALVGEEAAAGVGADAEDFSAGAHLAVRGVVEDVGLEAAGGLQGESSGLETRGEAGEIGELVEAEFDLGFDGHGFKRSF